MLWLASIQIRREELPGLSTAATKASTKLRMVMRQAPAIPDFAEISSDIEPLFREGLRNNNIEVIETVMPDVRQLLAQSVHHIRPFEPGDKGLKDAVIFKSILTHAQAQGVKSFYLLAGDPVFKHQDLREQAQKEGLAFKV